MQRIFVLAMIAGFALIAPFASAKDSLKPEDLVAKHLASVGTPEAIAAAKSRVVEGKVHVTFQSQTAAEDGKQTFASQGDKLHFYVGLPNPNYKGERFVSDVHCRHKARHSL